ncbi:MAG: hypothetical protein QHG99_01310 [Methanomicrobiales archaeon]|nr:hypothetical protein [Methanomicrobiales archaeon]
MDIKFRYPELVASLRRAAGDLCILDGEIVVIRKDRIDFQALQRRE